MYRTPVYVKEKTQGGHLGVFLKLFKDTPKSGLRERPDFFACTLKIGREDSLALFP